MSTIAASTIPKTTPAMISIPTSGLRIGSDAGYDGPALAAVTGGTGDRRA